LVVALFDTQCFKHSCLEPRHSCQFSLKFCIIFNDASNSWIGDDHICVLDEENPGLAALSSCRQPCRSNEAVPAVPEIDELELESSAL
jgi:hypothetical protein